MSLKKLGLAVLLIGAAVFVGALWQGSIESEKHAREEMERFTQETQRKTARIEMDTLNDEAQFIGMTQGQAAADLYRYCHTFPAMLDEPEHVIQGGGVRSDVVECKVFSK